MDELSSHPGNKRDNSVTTLNIQSSPFHQADRLSALLGSACLRVEGLREFKMMKKGKGITTVWVADRHSGLQVVPVPGQPHVVEAFEVVVSIMRCEVYFRVTEHSSEDRKFDPRGASITWELNASR
jgi:hypothetical protein